MKTTEPIDPRDQFDQWCDLWDQAQEDGVFPETETPPTAANQIPDYDYGLDEPESEPPLSQDDFESGDPNQDAYWNYVNSEEVQEQLFHEQSKQYTPNPIYPDSVGKDQEVPMPVWVDEKLLGEVEGLKRRLYDIECKVNAKDAGGKTWVTKARLSEDKSQRGQLDRLRQRIDRISNSLGIKDEPKRSVWAVED